MGKETPVPWGTWKSGQGLLLFVDISAGLLTAEFLLDLPIIYLRAMNSSFCGLLGSYFISARFCCLYGLILAVSSQKMSVGSKSGNSEDRGTSIPAVGRERWQPPHAGPGRGTRRLSAAASPQGHVTHALLVLNTLSSFSSPSPLSAAPALDQSSFRPDG